MDLYFLNILYLFLDNLIFGIRLWGLVFAFGSQWKIEGNDKSDCFNGFLPFCKLFFVKKLFCWTLVKNMQKTIQITTRMANCFFIVIFKYSVTSAYCNHGCNVINRLILQIFVRFHNSIWHLYTKANQTACLVNVIIQLLLSDTARLKRITVKL